MNTAALLKHEIEAITQDIRHTSLSGVRELLADYVMQNLDPKAKPADRRDAIKLLSDLAGLLNKEDQKPPAPTFQYCFVIPGEADLVINGIQQAHVIRDPRATTVIDVDNPDTVTPAQAQHLIEDATDADLLAVVPSYITDLAVDPSLALSDADFDD